MPGSRTERALLESFSRMLPELLRFSSSSRLLTHIPESMQAVHRVGGKTVATVQPGPVNALVAQRASLDALATLDSDDEGSLIENTTDDFDDSALAALGL